MPKPRGSWPRGGAEIRYEAGERACYRLATDCILLPERGQFLTSDAFYGTALHETGHSTGHPSRLNRDLAHPFGSEGYAREELRAEIASMMLGEQLGIGHDPGQHVAYIGSWIQALQKDPREIFRATADAEKIVRYVRGLAQAQEVAVDPERSVATTAPGERGDVKTPLPVPAHRPAPGRVTDERIYLFVPYREKDEAKAAAKLAGFNLAFDREAKAWWAPAGVDLGGVQRWRTGPAVAADRDPREEFAQALRDGGLLVEGLPEMDGQLRRVRVEGDTAGEKSGAYLGFADGHPAGYLQNFKTGLESHWKSSRRAVLNAPDLARLNAEAGQRREARELARQVLFEKTVAELEAHLAEARPATDDHSYLQRKGVDASPGLFVDMHGTRSLPPGAEKPQFWSERGNLLLPVRDLDGHLLGVQSIDAEGRKSFPRGGRVQGGLFMIGNPETSPAILIAEGYATGRTVHTGSGGLAVAVAFNSGNLPAVAQALRARFPDKPLYIAGDNDHRKAREIGSNGQPKPNVGREKAEEAARLAGGQPLLPTFRPEEAGSDWNDLARLRGKEVVREQLRAGIAIGAHRQRAIGRARAPAPAEPVMKRARGR